MIVGFRHKGLKRLFEHDDPSRLPPDMIEKIALILTLLDAAGRPEALDLPGLRLHRLKHDLAGFWSVTVRANWRIVFRFEGRDAADVDFVDYH